MTGFGGAVQQPASQAEISGSPLWHFHDYDLIDQTFTLIRIEEEIYRKASFLDHRIDSFQLPKVRYEMQHLEQVFPSLGQSRGEMGFIFHIGHCGSTLLSRALSVTSNVLPFREPLCLRTLTAQRHELNTPMSMLSVEQWESLLGTLLDSLSRRFGPGQMNVIKATSTSNNLIRPVLEENPSQKAVLLYLPLETYLATMLGKPRQASDLWVQGKKRMLDWMGIEGAPRLELHQLQGPQLATLSWLTSMNYMLAAREKYADRTLMLNFETMISDPSTHLAEVASFLGISPETDSIVREFPGIASGYSKQPDQKYSPETRAQLLQQTRANHAQSIDTGIQWARSRINEAPALTACTEFLN